MGISIESSKYDKKVAKEATKAHNARPKSKPVVVVGDTESGLIEQAGEEVNSELVELVLSESEDKAETVVEEVVEAPVEEEASAIVSNEDLEASLREDLSIHTKAGLEEYARENLDLELDKRKSKSDLIDTIVEASIK